MAKRDILKEAIADAKTVKETAIANAKAALEEAFTPQLKSMLATKLEEMELEEEQEALEEAPMKAEKTNKKGQPDMRKEKEYKPEKMTRDRIKEEDLDEEIDLDEILAEIELDEEKEDKDLKEDEKTDAEEEGFLDGKKDGEEEEKEDMEDEEIDLEDMTDNDLKDFIEDVIADMVASGELEAGENFEEKDEMEMDTEVDVEISEGKKKKDEDKDDVKEAKEEMDEAYDDMDEVMTSRADMGAAGGAAVIAKAVAKAADNFKGWTKEKVEAFKKWNDEMNKPASALQSKIRKAGTGKPETFLGLEEELEEAHSTIESLRSDLNEVNLLNAKLLYTNKIFRAKTLTESQKVKVLGAFDKASTVKETKLVFETLNEGLKAKKTTIKESLGSASRVSGNVNTKKPIVETDPMVERFKKLAGLK